LRATLPPRRAGVAVVDVGELVAVLAVAVDVMPLATPADEQPAADFLRAIPGPRRVAVVVATVVARDVVVRDSERRRSTTYDEG
jgi:hypothetical protein